MNEPLDIRKVQGDLRAILGIKNSSNGEINVDLEKEKVVVIAYVKTVKQAEIKELVRLAESVNLELSVELNQLETTGPSLAVVLTGESVKLVLPRKKVS